MQKAIVTGANSFVGNYFIRELISHNVQVLALDMKGFTNNIPKSDLVAVCECSLDEIKTVSQKITERDFDIFYHFAWAGVSGPVRANPEAQLKNALWTFDCMYLAKEMGCKRFVCAGSIMEHETLASAFTPGNKPGMGYIYGSGKLVAHTMGMSIAADLGIDLIWPEITNTFGVGELSPRLINSTLRKILNNEPLQFTAGTQNYDFVYITDVARAFYLIGEKGKPFTEYLIGSGKAQPLRNFILEIKNTVAPDKEFIFGDIPFTGTDLPLSKFDITRTKEDTGFEATVSFSEGIRKTFEWIKEIN